MTGLHLVSHLHAIPDLIAGLWIGFVINGRGIGIVWRWLRGLGGCCGGFGSFQGLAEFCGGEVIEFAQNRFHRQNSPLSIGWQAIAQKGRNIKSKVVSRKATVYFLGGSADRIKARKLLLGPHQVMNRGNLLLEKANGFLCGADRLCAVWIVGNMLVIGF